MELEKIHDCKKCHGKIVCISIDQLGVTRCGYCNEIVDYRSYMRKVTGVSSVSTDLLRELH